MSNLIMYRVSNRHGIVEFNEYEIIKETDFTVTFDNGLYEQRENKLKAEIRWFKNKYNAIQTATKWANDELFKAHNVVVDAAKALCDIELIALGESK
jgi:hypothetical protein